MSARDLNNFLCRVTRGLDIGIMIRDDEPPLGTVLKYKKLNQFRHDRRKESEFLV